MAMQLPRYGRVQIVPLVDDRSASSLVPLLIHPTMLVRFPFPIRGADTCRAYTSKWISGVSGAPDMMTGFRKDLLTSV